MSTFEVRAKEWYCVTCEAFYEWLHARKGAGPNPTEELEARYRAAEDRYDSERASRAAAVDGQPT